MTCADPFSTTDFVSRLFLVVFQVLGTSAFIPSLASYWCRFTPCLYDFSMISSSQDEEMPSGIEEMETELDVGGNVGSAGFSLCIANFATIAKILQSLQIFAMHSNFRYDR